MASVLRLMLRSSDPWRRVELGANAAAVTAQGATVYYRSTFPVDAVTNDGSIAAGNAATLAGSWWFSTAADRADLQVVLPDTGGSTGRSELAAAIVTADIAITTSMADLAGFVTPSFDPAGASLEIVLSIPEAITGNCTFQVLDTGNANAVVAKGKTVAGSGVTVRGLMGSTTGARTFKVQALGSVAATLKADALGQTATLSIITR